MILIKRILLFSLVAVNLLAQAPPVQSKYKPEYFTFQEVMIPMRDGVRLQTVIRTPKNAAGPLPILLVRTPYGVPENANSLTESGLFDDLIVDGYVFVTQNIRGRFKSEGAFVMQRPARDKRDVKSIDEATDAYDTVDWLVKNVPNNNGRVGMWGISYPGWLVPVASNSKGIRECVARLRS
jgi:putative CocE/NonD family hydrolase